MEVLILIGVMLVAALLGINLVFAILIASTATLLVYRPGIPLEVVTQLFLSGIDSFLLLAVGFFSSPAN